MEAQVTLPQETAHILTIEELIPRITVVVKHVRAGSVEVDVEDIVNHVVADIMQHAQTHPDFLSQKEAFVIQFAGWSARKALHKERRDGSRFFDFSIDASTENEFDDGCLWGGESNAPQAAEFSAASEDDHVHFELDEIFEQGLAGLHPSYRTLVNLLFAGLPKNEIAEAMGITPPSLQDRIKVLRRHIGPLL